MNSPAQTTPLLEVRNLSKHFGAVRALNDFSMVVRPGEVVALAGDNGAGKTTLIKAISGVFQPTGGEILLRGQPVTFATPHEAREKGIETIYQDLALADNLSIGANIFLGREPMRKAFGFLPVLDRKAMAVAAKQTMGRLDFHVSRLDAPVSNFSGGQRQAVAIGRAVYWDAQILIMDEPTAALGVPEQRKVISLIHQLKAQGRGVIFISHNLQDIFAVSDRIVVLRRGVQAGERKISETNHDEVVKLMVGG
ncbi:MULTISPECIES: ATP-binding cassette domain-containing protein [unclassified Mesorhizobium]|uniref:ATP-binding cassette domain-containing protein n=1 Tax=unclassified Mesorhizobium TaxID=325217 RepID=UPI000FCC4780|nr:MULTISPECIES: ATP-binding cassette domain-containing protein [unclassified Mesorhizobium]RUU30614.1 sugar ABC transporter ATP-binding protein [Mesorhizobium sp. M6A.T.Ce.TU.016.01.1.1]RVB76291.1 sugar ABC transporter ATP-binding protein [Mesorhizobium sp. M6A.T.Cr.TU.014.01.1.1]RWP79700.1 MAG: sugar ABC transporter ATP-binding protein [Mesorhizobium sp.]RWQ04374.1 MAG: sugar ABC transporter ATP-binding protein [Mesorhizobium sp.]RWQ04767.1 MAG: sugar ABC transporter ATP-binding protein [Mes